MPDFEAIEVLTQAKERLFDEGWCRAGTGDLLIERGMCIGQALSGDRSKWTDISNSVGPVGRANGYLKDVIGIPKQGNLWSWNDLQLSAGPVFDAIDAALEIAKDAPTPC